MASAWGNSWGTAWGNSWGSGVSPAPVTQEVIRNFSLKEWRRWRKPEDDAELNRRGIEVEAAEIIDDVALRQAEDYRLDEQQKLEELRQELRLRRIELKTAHIEALNERRAEVLRDEIGRLLRLRMQNEEDMIILLMLAEAVS